MANKRSQSSAPREILRGDALPRHIPNEQLQASMIPRPTAGWDAIQRFALTFDGYKRWGDECGVIANARRQGTLTELRTCLFYEQRRWRHFGEKPDADAISYIRSLVEQIRQRVQLANDLLA